MSLLFFDPALKAQDFKHYKKSIKLERQLIRVIINQETVVQQNQIKARHYHGQTLEQKEL